MLWWIAAVISGHNVVLVLLLPPPFIWPIDRLVIHRHCHPTKFIYDPPTIRPVVSHRIWCQKFIQNHQSTRATSPPTWQVQLFFSVAPNAKCRSQRNVIWVSWKLRGPQMELRWWQLMVEVAAVVAAQQPVAVQWPTVREPNCMWQHGKIKTGKWKKKVLLGLI